MDLNCKYLYKKNLLKIRKKCKNRWYISSSQRGTIIVSDNGPGCSFPLQWISVLNRQDYWPLKTLIVYIFFLNSDNDNTQFGNFLYCTTNYIMV